MLCVRRRRGIVHRIESRVGSTRLGIHQRMKFSDGVLPDNVIFEARVGRHTGMLRRSDVKRGANLRNVRAVAWPETRQRNLHGRSITSLLRSLGAFGDA